MARWHRRLALALALWLAVLALSGFLMNHAHDWGLDRKPLPATLQSALYGLETLQPDFCSEAPSLGTECQQSFGRIDLPAGALLLSRNFAILLDRDGNPVERISASQLALREIRSGVANGERVYLRDGSVTVWTDTDLLDGGELSPQEEATLEHLAWIESDGLNAGVSWERLIQDLHAARFLGPLAKPFNDLVAALILLLVVSGAWVYRLQGNGNSNGNGRGKNGG
jgi:hypothetical protein